MSSAAIERTPSVARNVSRAHATLPAPSGSDAIISDAVLKVLEGLKGELHELMASNTTLRVELAAEKARYRELSVSFEAAQAAQSAALVALSAKVDTDAVEIAARVAKIETDMISHAHKSNNVRPCLEWAPTTAPYNLK